MIFEAISVALTTRCLIVTYRLRDTFFHVQAWKAWVTFFWVLLALHTVEIAGIVAFSAGDATTLMMGEVVEVVTMVSLWLAVELTMPTLARRWFEVHNDARAVERACQLKMREMDAQSRKSMKPVSTASHSQSRGRSA